jgi:hypothetical protein
VPSVPPLEAFGGRDGITDRFAPSGGIVLAQRSESRARDVLVDLRRIAGDTDRADHATFVENRRAALERCCTGQREGSYASVAHLILEDLGGPPEDRSGAGLGDADIDTRELRVVESLESQQRSGVVDDGGPSRSDAAYAGSLPGARQIVFASR